MYTNLTSTPYDLRNTTDLVPLDVVVLVVSYVMFYLLAKMFLVYILVSTDHIKPLRYKAAILTFIYGSGIELLLHHTVAYLAKYVLMILMLCSGGTVLAIWLNQKQKSKVLKPTIRFPQLSPQLQSLSNIQDTTRNEIFGTYENNRAESIELTVFTIADVHSKIEEPIASPSGKQLKIAARQEQDELAEADNRIKDEDC